MTNGTRFEHLVAVRGIAAFVVLAAHVIQVFWLRIFGLGSWPHVVSSTASYYAVVTFFVLSGFLIAYSVDLNMRRNGRLDLGEFFAARLARLYPPLLFAIALSLLVFLLLNAFGLTGTFGPIKFDGDLFVAREVIRLPPEDLLSALLMKSGLLDINGPLWSLYIEAKLYALFAGVVFLLSGRVSVVVPAMICAVAYAGIVLNPEFVRYSAIWLVGCCAYYVREGRAGSLSIRRAVLFPALVLFIVVADFGADMFSRRPQWLEGRAIGVDVAIAGVIAWVLFWVRPGSGSTSSRSDCSYSLYVTHFPIMLLFNAVMVRVADPDDPLMMVAVFSVLAVVAALGIARIGGKIENAKIEIQLRIFSLWSRTYQVLRRSGH